MLNFRVRICGCRDFGNYELLKEKCLYYLQNKMPNVTIVSGAGRGADYLGEQFAKEYGLELEIYKPDWNSGKSAGPKNNEKIIQNVDAAIAFWDGESKGTKSTIEFCKQYNKKCIVVDIRGDKNDN